MPDVRRLSLRAILGAPVEAQVNLTACCQIVKSFFDADGSDPPEGRGEACPCARPPRPIQGIRRGGAPVHVRWPRIDTARAAEGPEPQQNQQYKEALPCTSKRVFRAHGPHCLCALPDRARPASFGAQNHLPRTRLDHPVGTVKLTDLVPNQRLGKSLSC